MPTCTNIMDDTFIDTYPDAYGDYISIAEGPKGLGIAFYDRLHGNLVGAANTSGDWTTTIFDGETGSRTTNPPTAMDTGDVGVGASLFIDTTGDWHVSYVNGFTEALQYIKVTGGTTPGTPEVVDNGQGIGGTPFSDGQHIVGDDSTIHVDENGVVTIAYQDATVGTLHVASGALVESGTHTWTVTAPSQPGRFAGYFAQSVPGTPMFSNWWRTSDQANGAVYGDVAILTP